MTVTVIRRMAFVVVGVLGLTAFLAACGGSDDQSSSASDIQEITIEAQDLSFSPTSFTVDTGKRVRLTLVNAGTLEHDVTIPGINATDEIVEASGDSAMGHQMMGTMAPGTVHLAAHGGDEVTVEFMPRAGMFELYCSVAGHKDAGMVGTVDVN